MCVIIARAPNVDIDPEKIESACIVNNDGYGFTVINDGKFDTYKNVAPNKAAELIKRLEDAKDQMVMVHLRFRTDGDISLENCHPFTVTTKDDHGIDIQLMHNGVISDFSGGKDEYSDTYRFNELILKPLFIRSLKALEDPSKWASDPTISMIVHKYAGAGNVFTIYDTDGNSLVTNKARGVEHKGWWASNAYSFNSYHRTPAKQTSSGGVYAGPPYGGYNAYKDDNDYWNEKDNTPPYKDNKPPFDVNRQKTIPKLEDKRNQKALEKAKAAQKESARTVGSMVASATDTAKYIVPAIIPPESRPTFLELTRLNSLSDLAFMEYEDLEDMVTQHPEVTTILLMDLIFTLYQSSKESSPKSNSPQGRTNYQGVG